MDGADHLGEPVRTALAALCLLGGMALAIIIVSQFGGLDSRELAGLMGKPAPEQVILPSSPREAAEAWRPHGGAAGGSDPERPKLAMPPLTDETPQPETAGASEDGSASTERVEPAHRNVTAPGMTPAPTVVGPLEREAVPKRPPAPPKWKAFSPVVVREAGLLDLGPRNVRLAGIVVPDGDRLCHPGVTGNRDIDMPCSRLAMVALRSRIRAFGVECLISANDAADPARARCRIGKTDLALWMIEQGWAEAASNAPKGYAAAEKEARCARRGIWQAGDPPADCLQN